MARAAIVTGAASGIGRAIADRLRTDGYDVLGVDLTGSDHDADLTTREGNSGAVDAAVDRFGGLDVIVANAGMQKVAPVGEFPEDSWDQLIALLLTSPFLLARHGWEALGASGDRRLLAGAPPHALGAAADKSADGLATPG